MDILSKRTNFDSCFGQKGKALEITGLYYRTLLRDGATGETLFDISPSSTIDLQTVDGLLRCKGVIKAYAKNVPLRLTGRINNGIFYIEDERFLSGTRESALSFLEYAAKGLTDVQKRMVCEIVNDDFLAFGNEQTDEQKKKLQEIVKDPATCRDIVAKAKRLAANEKLSKQLLDIGVPADVVSRICNDEKAVLQLNSNPYQLFLFHGLTAYHADNYMSGNIEAYAPIRIAGYVEDAILLSEQSGNTCIRVKKLVETVNYRLKNSLYPDSHINMPLFLYAAETILHGKVKIFIYGDDAYVYRQNVFESEKALISHIKRLNMAKYEYAFESAQDTGDKIGIVYNEGQKSAFDLLEASGVKILTGGPGTGKTTTIKGLILAFKAKNPYSGILIAATTGTAAQVLSDACGMEAQTVYRMLDIRPYGGNKSGKNENNPLDADLIIVDECSMLGLDLASMLVEAVKSGSILILVGDADQLESVDYGNVFNDLIASNKVDVRRLTECLRQDDISIWKNATKVLEGDVNLEENEVFAVKRNMDEMNVRHMLLKNADPMNDLILTPIKKGNIGVFELNRILQEKSRMSNYDDTRQLPCAVYARQQFYTGDRVMLTETNYKKGYYNGDVGEILGSAGDRSLVLQLKYDTVEIDNTDYRVMDLAYARTIHKLQGSEADTVYVVLPETKMLSRRLLYTAITRAKKKVIILAVGNAIEIAIHNTNEHKRCTLLACLLQEEEYGQKKN